MHWYPHPTPVLPELAATAPALAPEATLYVIYSADESRWDFAAPEPGWSYRDTLSHIASGDWVLQRHLSHVLDTDTLPAWPDVDAGNAARIAERRFTSWQTLTDEYLSMRHETLRLLSELKPKHLALAIEMPWLVPEKRSGTVLDYLRRFPRHDAHHRDQLRGIMRHKTSTRA
jgi:hypothetical protein